MNEKHRDAPAYFDADKYAEFYNANKDDPYGFAGVEIVNAWAASAEEKIAAGMAPAQAFDEAQWIGSEACGGATGFLMGCAASLLRQIWTRGPEFGVWWNQQHAGPDEASQEAAKKAADEGRVANPALLTIG
jgi:hypothetical protein